MGLGVAAVARAAQHLRASTFAGKPCNRVAAESRSVFGDRSRIVMFGITPRPHKRICERTWKDWRRGKRRNAAALQRFLFREDGTVWRKQGKQRHFKSKRSPAHNKRLKRMVRVVRMEYRRVQVLTGRRPKIPK